jgi:hypothetical protein
MIGTTSTATIDNAPTCDTVVNNGPGVWYKTVGVGDMVFIASTCDAANFDTKISVFTGACDDLKCVAGNDDTEGCSGFTTRLGFNTAMDVEYLILVHSFDGESGEFDLTLTSIPNDGVSTRIESSLFEGVCCIR